MRGVNLPFGKFMGIVKKHNKLFICGTIAIYVSYKVYPYVQYCQTLYQELNKSYQELMLSNSDTNTLILDIGGAKIVARMKVAKNGEN